jgi:hypothetical protein
MISETTLSQVKKESKLVYYLIITFNKLLDKKAVNCTTWKKNPASLKSIKPIYVCEYPVYKMVDFFIFLKEKLLVLLQNPLIKIEMSLVENKFEIVDPATFQTPDVDSDLDNPQSQQQPESQD